MTHHRAPSLSFSAALAGALLLAAPASAQSECQPDDLLCAEVRIGPAQGGIRIGPAPQLPPPPPLQPPVVIVQPEEPVYQPPPPPPQPPVVIVQPQQPPPPVTQYVVQAPPRQVYVQPQPQSRFPYSQTGLHLNLGGVFGDSLAMGGGGAAFRIRAAPWFALDIGAGLYGGTDYNGLDRVEVPVTVDALIFFNPQHRFQFYILAGVGTSFGHAEGFNFRTGNDDYRDYVHLGGEAGLGLEWRLGRHFALNVDVRGFLRHRVDDNPEPEFTEPSGGGWRSTDLSGGVVARGGMTFYFGR